MKYRKLGRTGFEVSEMAHGLWGMSGWSGSDDHESLDALQLATDLGCNFFDTAWAYGEGKSDGLLGEILSRNPSPPNPASVCTRLPRSRRSIASGRRESAYKYQDVFPAAHVFKHADMIRKKLRDRLHRPAAISRLGRQLDRRTGIPQHGREAQARRNHPVIRAQPQPLGARKWSQGFAHRAGGCGAGDPQHFRSGARGQTLPGLPGTERRRDRARSARRRQPGRKDDAAKPNSPRATGGPCTSARRISSRLSREWRN